MILALLWPILSLASWYQQEPWRRIEPLRSTRTDVERLLGPPTAACKCLYESEAFNVSVHYSSGNCESEYSAWNVPADTVIRFTVYFAKRPLMSDLRIDWDRFVKTDDPEVVGYTYYVNKVDGLIISVYQERVTEYDFVPKTKDNRLRCPGNLNALAESERWR